MTYKTDTHTILYSDKVKPDAQCFTRLIAAMQQLSLGVAYPLEPNYHRRYGIYECNQVQIGCKAISPVCIALTNELYEKYSTFDIPKLSKITLQLDVKHGLVCNALIYG